MGYTEVLLGISADLVSKIKNFILLSLSNVMLNQVYADYVRKKEKNLCISKFPCIFCIDYPRVKMIAETSIHY